MNQTKASYFLDSTTLIHAVDKSASYHEKCLSIVNKAAKGEINAATSLETLEETLFILSKLTSTTVAVRATQDYLRMSKIKKFDMDLKIFDHAVEIMDSTSLKHPKDAINVATMLQHDIPLIISEDGDYDKIRLIQRVHPKDLG